VEDALGDADDVAVARVSEPDDVTDAIYEILSTEADGDGAATAGDVARGRTDGGENR